MPNRKKNTKRIAEEFSKKNAWQKTSVPTFKIKEIFKVDAKDLPKQITRTLSPKIQSSLLKGFPKALPEKFPKTILKNA